MVGNPHCQRVRVHILWGKWMDAAQKAEVPCAFQPGMPVVTINLRRNRLAILQFLQGNP
jgi:hypothetical protein